MRKHMAAAKKSPAKKSAKPVARKGATAKPVRKAIVKKQPAKAKAAPRKPVPAKKPAAPSKPVKASPAAKAGTAAKPSKPASPAKPAAKAPVAAAKPAPAAKPQSGRKPRSEKLVYTPSAVSMATVPTPLVVAAKPTPEPSPQDLVAAHEYLLARSATRSEEAVTVNGKRLPTEGDLLKMPETSYMNDQQLAFFRHRLQEMERELLQNAGETTEHLRETVIVPDPADRATIEEEHALELRTRDRERKLLKKVQQALTRIDSGDYGYCEETGEPIGVPRLLARPTATLSLEAQQRREMKQRMFGD
jgi:DnaK suppressor protein